MSVAPRRPAVLGSRSSVLSRNPNRGLQPAASVKPQPRPEGRGSVPLRTKNLSPVVASGALDALPRLWRPEWRAAALIADRRVLRLHGPSILRRLARCAPVVRVFSFPPGERSKTREMKAALEDRLLRARLGRDTCVVALGGGVALDLAGFVAATYLRGVPSIYVPTTLLAQIDAAVGGKTGVDVPGGKNLVGAFHFPAAVLIDPRFLRTLPPVEWRCGLAEMVKHAVIGDARLFAVLERSALRLRRPHALDADLLLAALRVKLEVVRRDPFEAGLRAVLNFGHTIAHALESASGHRVPHGLAVAVGMVVEADVAVARGILARAARDRLVALHGRLGLPTFDPTPFARLAPFLAVDKKNRAGALHVALPGALGTAIRARRDWTGPVSLAELRTAWNRRASSGGSAAGVPA
ncbi:MAG: 3-dehydroquinate synthase [Deltaproteobacteria bacterium]|nr:3-dehydroquinate synthase [Deltaproteobacteria bacterium]